MRTNALLLTLLVLITAPLKAVAPPDWQPGWLEIHHLNTGQGNAAFALLPDGTTLLIDAGAVRGNIPYADPIPDDSQSAGQRIINYIVWRLADRAHQIDYALISHFHSDHLGGVQPQDARSAFGDYQLSGITEVAESLPIRTLLDRGWPEYNYPVAGDAPYLRNYIIFARAQSKSGRGTTQRFSPGRSDQIVLRHARQRFPAFEVRNLAANGDVWTGRGNSTRSAFPPREALAPRDYPSENMCSAAIRIRLGAFDYYTGGDLPGVPDAGAPQWHDLETPIARAIGQTDVIQVNHHGSIDPANPFFLSTLQPRVVILPSWAPSHPAPSVLKRLLSRFTYSGPRDIFATMIREPTATVIGRRINQLASQRGHVVIRVSPDGASYWVWVLSDDLHPPQLRSEHGPYRSR